MTTISLEAGFTKGELRENEVPASISVAQQDDSVPYDPEAIPDDENDYIDVGLLCDVQPEPVVTEIKEEVNTSVGKVECVRPYDPSNVKHKDKPAVIMPMENSNSADISKRLSDFNDYVKRINSRIQTDEKWKDDDVFMKEIEDLEFFKEIHTKTSLDLLFKDALFDDRINSSSSDWRQSIPGPNGKKIRIAHPLLKGIDDSNSSLSGDVAAAYVRNRLSTGKPTIVQLWLSGIVIQLKPFNWKQILNLAIKLNDDRITIGRITRGITYSGDDVYLLDTIVDFILDHVIACNLEHMVLPTNTADEGWMGKKIKSLMNPLDIQSLVCGALECIYPDGYPIYYWCVNYTKEGKDKCDYVKEAKRKSNGDFEATSLLDFKAMHITDNARLRDSHRSFMSTMDAKSTADILDYQLSLNDPNEEYAKKVILDSDDKWVVQYRTPKFQEFISTTYKWVNEINALVTNALKINSDLDDEDRMSKRQHYVSQHLIALDGIKSLAWIASISITNNDGKTLIISDYDGIEKSMSELNTISGVKETFANGLQAYKENSVIGLTGISNFACPKCKCGQVNQNSKSPTLIPIDMVSYFFTLTGLEAWRQITPTM